MEALVVDRDLAQMRRVAIVMYVMGAVSLGVVLLGPDPDTSDHAALAVMAGVLAASAGVVAVVPPGERVMRASYLWGILLVSAIVAAAKPIGAVPFFYLWPVLFGAYYFGRRDLWGGLAFMCATYGAALALWGEPGIRSMLFTGAMIPVALVAILVHLLRGRLDRAMGQLRHAAATDPLTGMPNRRAFDEALEREVERSRRSGLPLSVAVVDIDFFKGINDRFGHAGGDRALRRFAELVSDELRPGDMAARIGGDEFAILMVNADRVAGAACTLRIASRVAGQAEADEAPLSLSAGVASASGDLPEPDRLLLTADHALYSAKGEGRGRVALEDGTVVVVDGASAAPA
jgi:diguanylate cyclase (GGDEF)-like protein